MASKTFMDLAVWQEAHRFVLDVYRVTEEFPKTELFGLTSQLRRAAVSIPANIAEGFKRYGKNDKRRFYNISQGSVEECRYYLILAGELRYTTVAPELIEEIDRVGRMLSGYMQAVPK